VDESGFLMTPLVRRTLAPCGRTPRLLHRAAHRRKVSVAGAVCRPPGRGRLRLFWQSFVDGYVDADGYAQFLWDLSREIAGPLVLLQDRAPLHHGEAMADLLEDLPRLSVEEFPAYAPHLNPAEFLWQHLKWERLANFAALDLDELFRALHAQLAAASTSQARLQSFLDSSDLTW
jgi:putative transposase